MGIRIHCCIAQSILKAQWCHYQLGKEWCVHKNEEEKDTAQTATPTTLEAAKSAAKQRALELRQLGAVVFSGYFQCLHCGEYGTTTFPHNWKPCAACKLCKNCGGIHAGRSTSDCPSPDPNIYAGNTPVAAWGMQF